MMLDIRGLTCGYGNVPVLKNIDVTIGKGELVAVIGPNGSGKTTLLRAVSKVVKPAGGSIYLEGDDIRRLSYRELATRIAVVTNLRDADLRMHVEEFVLLGRIPHRKGMKFMEGRGDLRCAHDAMVRTGILNLRNRLVDNLSSGEKQLVFIARALAQEPALLLLDEPTSHLDITHQVRVLDLIRRLNQEKGLTVITVLHDLNLAGQYCDRLILLKDGSIFRDGTPKEVLTYRIVEEVYNTLVVVLDNPVTGKPYVFLVSEDERDRKGGRPVAPEPERA
jgi:iron complex transport system ATP-binding protein